MHSPTNGHDRWYINAPGRSHGIHVAFPPWWDWNQRSQKLRAGQQSHANERLAYETLTINLLFTTALAKRTRSRLPYCGLPQIGKLTMYDSCKMEFGCRDR